MNNLIVSGSPALSQEAYARQAQELEAFYATTLEINSQKDLKPLLNSIIERAVKLTCTSAGGLYLIEPDGKTLKCVVGYNVSQVFVGIKLAVGKGVTGRAASEGKPMRSGDQGTWKGRAKISLGSTLYRRVLAVPLKLGDKVIGVINLSDDENLDEFSEQDIRLASMFADQAALAVEKARLYDEERQRSLALARSNRMIAGLSQVGTLMLATVEPTEMMETIGSELRQMGIFIQIALLDPQTQDLIVQYTSLDANVREKIDENTGIRLLYHRIPETVFQIKKMMELRNYLFVTDPSPYYLAAFPNLPATVIRRVMRLSGITQKTGMLYLPMMIKDLVVGLVSVWGEDVIEADAPGFSIFANQLAVTLENIRLYAELQKQALFDELTGLYNRRGFFTLAEQQLKMSRRLMTPLMLIFIDVDRLKAINDTFGHQEGDQALIETATVLKHTFRTSDIIARMGGDEFAVVVASTSENSLDIILDRLTQNIDRVNSVGPRKFSLSMSTGMIPWTPEQTETIDDLLSQADALMYSQKRLKKKELINIDQ